MSTDDILLTDEDAVPLPWGEAGAVGTVAGLALTGQPLIDGLTACSEEASNSRDRRVLRRLSQRLDRGESLEQALTGTQALPPYLKGVLSAGVRSGQLPRLLSEYLTLSRQVKTSQRQFWLACSYPIFILAGMLTLGILFPVYIVPQLKEMFTSFGIELPWATQTLVTFSDSVINWPWVLALLLGVPLFVVVAHEYLPGVSFRQWLYSWLPFLGESARLMGLSELCLQLSLLVRGRLPLPGAFRVLGDSLQNRSLRRGCHQLAGRLSAGEEPDDMLHESSAFAPEVLQLLSATGSPEVLADQLQLAGRAYATQAQVKTRQALMIFEPFFLVVFAAGFLFIVYALFGPLFKLLNDLA